MDRTLRYINIFFNDSLESLKSKENNEEIKKKVSENTPSDDIDKLKERISELEKKLAETSTQFCIAEKRKTDFIKIINAMYELRMFETTDGKIASNKQLLFNALGSFFNNNFEAYSTLLSNAKETANYLEVFEKLKEKAENYYNTDKKK
jgi:vacuolar-type H+-ATPase subunit I/STV1